MNFRTACEDDADVIEMFVNNFFDFECGEVESSSPSSSSSSGNLTRGTPFRAKGPRITKDEIETDLVEGGTNWIVLEDMDADDLLDESEELQAVLSALLDHVEELASLQTEDQNSSRVDPRGQSSAVE